MKKKNSVLINKKIGKFNKIVKVAADKSLSLRALMLASQCIGISKIKNLLESEDVLNCLKALRTLGVKIVKDNNIYSIYGNGLNSFKTKKKVTKIFVGNSGTTARLLSGLLSTQTGRFYLYGDQSMNRRDMSRIIEPLEKIGCFFYPKKKNSVLINKKIEKFNKIVKVAADKSLSLRALMLASQCIGISKIRNLLESEDVLNCLKALKTLGVKIVKDNNAYLVYGNGLNSFKTKKKITKIFVGNSGTTARLLPGLLSAHVGKFYLYGDKSMNKRDMSRVIKPLERIGCFFYPPKKLTLPLT